MHHQGHLGIVGDADLPDGLTFATEHGLILGPAGRPVAPKPGDMPHVDPYDGPTGERLHTDCVCFTPTPQREPAA